MEQSESKNEGGYEYKAGMSKNDTNSAIDEYLIDIVSKLTELVFLLDERTDIMNKRMDNLAKEIHRLSWEIIELENKIK